jgi:hypothetical protein
MEQKEFISYCNNLKPDIIVQKYIIENETYFFTNEKIGEEFEFKKDIANTLDVHIRDIVIVGSGKLGFSLKPDDTEPGLYLFKKFDSNINKKSDLDIGVISSDLFDRQMKNLYDFIGGVKDKWSSSDRKSFAHFILNGRIAIRFLPQNFNLLNEIKQVVEKYQMEYGREINIEIYKSWHYFETYHRENIKNIQVNLFK